MRGLVVFAMLAIVLGAAPALGAEGVDPEDGSPRVVRTELRATLPAGLTCRDYPRSEVANDPFAFGAVGAIICNRTEQQGYRGVDYVALFQFPDAAAMADYWSARTRQNPEMPVRDRGCEIGRPAYGTWTHGDYFCARSRASRRALLRWTDTRSNTYGVVDATDRDIGQLYLAWVELREQPGRGGFHFAGRMNSLHDPISAVPLPDGRVGVLGFGGSLSAETWDPRTEAFSPAGSLATPRLGGSTTVLPDGRVLLAGGVSDGGPRGRQLATARLWDPAAGSFSPAGRMSEPKSPDHALLLPDGRVLIIGGCCAEDGMDVTTADVWDPATGRLHPTGSLATRREGSTATLLPDGRVLVIGGGDVEAMFDDELRGVAEAEIWDPATESFSPAGTMAMPRLDYGTTHAATLLPDGRVLVMGGGVATAELWEPATSSFRPAGTMIGRPEGIRAVLLPDGRVLAVSAVTGRAELWDPSTESFAPAGTMATADRPTATPLPDGRVLFAGGVSRSAELWDPATTSFEPAGVMAPTEGGELLGVLLPDGRVVFLGSLEAGYPAAQVWDPAGPGDTTGSAEPRATGMDRLTAEAALLDGVRAGIGPTCEPLRGTLPDGVSGGLECRPVSSGVDRVRLFLFETEQQMLDAYFRRLRSNGVRPRTTEGCWSESGVPCEGPYVPTLPKDRLTWPGRAGCFVDAEGRAHYLLTSPPFVTAEVIGRSAGCGRLHEWSWRGNEDIPGSPTVWG